MGLLAQAATLAASLVPVLWGRTEVVVFLVSVAAIATLLIPLLTNAATHRLPAIVQDHDFRLQLTAAIGSILIGSALAFVVILALLTQLGLSGALAFSIGTVALAASQSSYLLATATLTRQGTFRRTMILRLIYGLVSLVGTLIVTVLDLAATWYVFALVMGYVVALTVVVPGAKRSQVSTSRPSRQGLHRRDVVRVWRAGLPLTFALTIGALAGQIPALITPLLGGLSGSWAIAIRVMGGFQTVGSQIMGVPIDIRLSERVRSGANAVEMVRGVNQAAWVSLALSMAAAGVAVGAVALVAPPPESEAVLFGLIAITVMANVVLAPIGRLLAFFGGHRRQFYWELSRALVAGFFAITLGGLLLMVGITVVCIVAAVTYIALVRKQAVTVAGSS